MTESSEPATEIPAASHRKNTRSSLLVILCVLTLVVAVGFAAVALTASRPGSPHTISVLGAGTAKGAPDTVSFQVGVTTSAALATRALALNSAHVRQLEKALEAHGVTAADMQTSGLNIYQQYDNQGHVTGFSVSNTLAVTMHNLALAGSAIDAAAHAVGNGVQFDGVSFSLSHDSKLLARARRTAIAHANQAARQIARAAHASLGDPVRIIDHEITTPISRYYPLGLPAFGADKSVPLQAGTESVTVTATVIYSLTK